MIKRTLTLLLTLGTTLCHAADKHALNLKELERDRVVNAADGFLKEQPETVTAHRAARSAGTVHDFFSEGDYWWPDPNNPDGPYVQRDGMTNPDNFVKHRHSMIRLSIHVATLTAAHKITGDLKYADHAVKHLKAWFVDKDTLMNPHLQFAQAIKGRTTGRGIGIIDTIHLIEVSRSALLLERAGALKGDDLSAVKKWFADYITWMTTSKNGLEEMNTKNNHATCWVMQVASFASFTGDQEKLAFCRKRFKEVLLPDQMGNDGSFPQELRRTKPYGYSIFNLDAMAAVCHILSTNEENLWTFTMPDRRNMKKAVDYLHPYLKDKRKWPHKADVMYHEFWPVRSPALLFAAVAFNESVYLETWKGLEANPTNEEVIRNLPVRQPLLWVD